MTRILLIASVAALAITTPAQAGFDRENRGQRSEKAQQAEEQRGNRQQSEERRGNRQQATERRANRQQASERRANRQQASERRSSRQQAFERRSIREQVSSERRASRQRQLSERRGEQRERFSAVRSNREQVNSDRRARTQQMASDRRSRIDQRDSDRRARRQQELSDRRSHSQQAVSDRRSRIEQRTSDQRSRIQQAESDRRSLFQQQRSDRRSQIQQQRSDRRAFAVERRAQLRDLRFERRSSDDGPRTISPVQWREQAWEQRSDRVRALADRRERLDNRASARWWNGGDRDDDSDGFFRVGQQVSPNWWYDDYVPTRYRLRFDDDDDFYYRYDGDYLYRLRDNDNIVLSLFPLLGGAYSVGRPMPFYYNSYYNVPFGYSSLYYDTPDYYYRYGDGAIYQVDPSTQLIAGIVALLTGQSFGIGQTLPFGYDAYNVPFAYRSTYYDTDDMWYRYDDGYIYGVDPHTRLIQTSFPIYGGYAVGRPWPSYAGYGYDVPGYYDDLYYAQPGYDYRFASGGIYQVDPQTQLIAALVALVTGQNFAVGQQLPLSYDVYNVPFAYRDDYYDDDRNWYRYADGRIYQVDPGTRLIRQVILV